MKANDALNSLKEGNKRFVAGLRSIDSFGSPAQVAALTKGQTPFAIVLACSDSRVPVELVFDQGLGDLFVIRVAGNIVAPSIVGSAEFAAAKFGTRLVVVMGHSNCGAVGATVQAVLHGGEAPSANIQSIVSRILPTVEGVLEDQPGIDEAAAVERCVRANVRHSVDHLRHGSQVLEGLAEDGLLVVGAEYDLATGLVEFFDH